MPASRYAAFCHLLVITVLCAGCASAPTPAGVSVVRDVTYALRADGDLQADLYLPAGHGPFPAVITIHGGSWRTGWRWEMNEIARLLAARDIVVMNVSYRLVPAHHWPDQYVDVQDAVRWLRAHAADYHIDSAHIGAWGYSAGAQLALLLGSPDAPPAVTERAAATALPRACAAPAATATTSATTDSSRVQAVVGGGSPTDLRVFAANPLVTRYLNGTQEALPEAYRAASPIAYVSTASPPTFLYHGRDDWIVDISQSRTFAAALRAAGVSVELVELPRGHLSAFFVERDIARRAADFLQHKLHPAAAVRIVPSP